MLNKFISQESGVRSQESGTMRVIITADSVVYEVQILMFANTKLSYEILRKR
ncbi:MULTISPECIES: hypothetical protein [Okeania]|uniref:hypothetical protein n=1 Tax=Okeania TaxID=1458928 RepID=UPI0013750A3A|nr:MULTISPECIES: hypothetical protein [Okeania]NEP05650.1 hypothetical protein [Okeania sp. SIO4D6]NET13042.1 hypothetical protein [Okeania sp. SIO1H6]NEP72037.1 hypothetical protein [Okeania sp. SIO2G5]NEP89753.1 hypothetical protein [Okeania sp. SIO2C2]NEP93503.1 hypothetical protein [Okeania sp. SIO2F5]